MRERPLVGKAEFRSYYGKPIIKEPVWKPEIPAYFFVGGMAGASSLLALGARLTGNERLRFRAGLLSGLGVAVSPVLLIKDLGRPARFHHMLRVFKVTSPMSVGTWILQVAGGASGTAAALDLLGLYPGLRTTAEVVAGTLGAPLSTYTGALVAQSAVPAWHEARRELPLVFGASSAAAAGGILSVLVPTADARPARRLALLGAVTELAAEQAMERRLGFLAEPYHKGTAGRYAKLAKKATASGAGLLALTGRRRLGASIGGALLVAGSALTRWAVYEAGKASAADPAYTVRSQRERLAAGERTRTVPARTEQPGTWTPAEKSS
jgi:formate-dependent nitrite reductase membrane component NrfD